MSEKRFHNPYNFVPALPAKAQNGSPLAQGEPKGHDKYHDGRWSGRIGIEIEVRTPLILPDAARAIEKTEGPEKGHKTFGLRKYFDQDAKELRPLLPVTSFKGALRNGYEIITNSRLGVFEEHDVPPARRMAAREALRLVPVRVVSSENGLEAELLLGTNVGLPRWSREKRAWISFDENGNREPLYAAWLPRYRYKKEENTHRNNNKKKKGWSEWSLHFADEPNSLPKHGDVVWMSLRKCKKTGWFDYWCVTEIARTKEALNKNVPAAQHLPQGHRSTDETLSAVEGVVYVSAKNMGKKHDERVFFQIPETIRKNVSLSQSVAQRWKNLIKDYQLTNQKKISQRQSKNISLDKCFGFKDPAISRHTRPKHPTELKAGQLCYALLKADETKTDRPVLLDTNGLPTIVDLYPVMISRELGHVAPREMLDDRLWPATNFAHLSPADRVFGWVAQERDDKKQSAAWRGQLRILPIKCASGAKEAIEQPNGTDGIALTTLSTPKIAQARFYLSEKNGEPLKGDPNTSGYFEKVANGKAPQKALRGRKIYLHHRKHLPGEYQQVDNARSDQNRSITEWVKPGAKFTTDIDVINLKPEELGALLSLLDMNRWQTSNAPAHLRLGYGKPLGFGSVRCRITSLKLRDGAAKRADYMVLDNKPGQGGQRIDWTAGTQEQGNDMPNDVGDLVKSYQAQLQNDYAEYGKNFAQLPFISAWLRAARGFADGHPIHYPRKQAKREKKDENFKWFGWNESRHKLSLPSLIEKEGAEKSLPFAPAEQQRGNNRNQNNRGKNRRR